MNIPHDQNKSIEMLLQRLITMMGKSNEKVEHLHKRILQLECVLLYESSKDQASKKIG